ERVRTDIGPYLQSQWQTLAEHPLVAGTRMVGLMGAFEIVRNKEPVERFDKEQHAGTVFRDILMNEGVCLRAVGDTIVCAPPFVLSRAEADQMIDKVRIALDLTHRALSA
ncbi:MAG: aminotransferase class III-fold pyridoxal phosphate-dependent enzyme, partial [Gammaproteobacteria bacterium]|nr:aminotransferase class III-fold pyridoxal phosphate-dependent enzyme [Gammaproteobacteria bacterium]